VSPLSIYAAAGVVVLLVCWLGGWSFATDAGGAFDSAGRFFPWPDAFTELGLKGRRLARDKRRHAIAGAVLGFASTLYTHDLGGSLLVTFALGCGWECVEAFPLRGFRDALGVVRRRVGHWSWKDVVADMGGAIPAALAASLILLVVGAITLHRARPPASPALLQRDSLQATRVSSRATIDSVIHRAASAQAAVAVHVRRRRAAVAIADSIHAVLDSTPVPPAPADSVGLAWKARSDALESENALLRVAIVEGDTAIDSATVALQAHAVAEGLAVTRIDALEDNGEQLAAAVRAGDGCRIGPRWLHLHCPSRKAAAVTGAVLVGGAVLAVKVIPRVVRVLVRPNPIS
jgi:hypothetical protein